MSQGTAISIVKSMNVWRLLISDQQTRKLDVNLVFAIVDSTRDLAEEPKAGKDWNWWPELPSEG